MIYLDNAATTFPKPECVYTAMDKANRTFSFNAGRGSYKAAREASAIIDKTRLAMLKLFKAEIMADIVFTPSITHAINQVINGLNLNSHSTVYISPYEHNAVARTIYASAQSKGFRIEQLPLDEEFKIDVEKAEYQFTFTAPSLVILSAVSNVTGYVLPTMQIFSAAKKYGAITVLDGAQAAGLIPLDMSALNADIICFAGHKTLYGPFGIGGFAIKKDLDIKTTFVGGTGSNSLSLDMPPIAPGKYEAASPNIVALAGLHASLCCIDVQEHKNKIIGLTHYLLNRLSELPKVNILGAYAPGDTLGIVSVVVDNYSSDEVATILDEEFDIAVRSGYHCAPFIHDYIGDKPYNGTIRISLGMFNKEKDIDILVSALESL